LLPGKDGTPPPPRPSAGRATGDEDEMEDLDIQRRTAQDDQGSPLPAPAAVPQRRVGAGPDVPRVPTPPAAAPAALPARTPVAPVAPVAPAAAPAAGGAAVAMQQATPSGGAGRVTLGAPKRVPLGEWITVDWAGPGGNQDYIVLARPGARLDLRDAVGYRNARNQPVYLAPPKAPGTYEVWYFDDQNKRVLQKVTVEVPAPGDKTPSPGR
jgi:hypothetical protein